jgi:hypothetical protein
MRYVEEGKDMNGTECWFVLEGAELIGIYYTEEEAKEVANV